MDNVISEAGSSSQLTDDGPVLTFYKINFANFTVGKKVCSITIVAYLIKTQIRSAAYFFL